MGLGVRRDDDRLDAAVNPFNSPRSGTWGVEGVDGGIKSIVVPANAETHNHRRQLSCKASATSRNRYITRYGSPRSRGRRLPLRLTPPRRSTRPKCLFAHAGGFRPLRTPPIS